ncbi:hypothetical protein KAH55_10390 [bacterium]|nr:hypothetical protein [bacterium]
MLPKERVHRALKKLPVDRVPIFMWFHPDTAKWLSQMLEIPASRVDDAMKNDIKMTWANNNWYMEGIVHENDGEGHSDPWGISWEKLGPYNQISHYPIKDASKEDVLAYKFPYDKQDMLLELMRPVAAASETHFIGCDVSPCIFEMYCRLRGMEGAMLDMAADEALSKEMLKRCADFALALAEKACERYPLDWLWSGDDVASQQALMMHPDTWREQIKPHLARILDVGKKHHYWTAYHSCGAIRPIIPDLIEIGLNVLNPIQCTAVDMDPLSLKAEFGEHLAFMGGVDNQYLLPQGTPQEVRQATERLIDGMTADGGDFILAASHTIPPETPVENIFAMYDVAGITREEIFDSAAAIRKSLSQP